MDITVAFAGNQDISYANASQLLDDYLPGDCEVYIDQENTTDAMTQVTDFMAAVKQSYVRTPDVILAISQGTSSRKELIVLGSEGVEDLIKQAQHNGWKVSDLCRALHDPEMPLDGAESQAEPVTGQSGIPVRVESPEPSQGDPWRDSEYVSRAEMEEYVTGIIKVLRQEFHAPAVDSGAIAPVSGQGLADVETLSGNDSSPVETVTDQETLKYYKSKTGKFRKAGNSKARPGEVEVQLTQAEVDELPG
jgi:hypothetical protein